MTLRARLVAGLAIIAIVLIVPLIVARNAMIDLHRQVTALQNGEVKASIFLGSLRDAMADVRARDVELGVSKGDTVVYRDMLETIRTARAWADSVTATYPDTTLSRMIHDRLDSIVPVMQKEYAAYSAGQSDEGDSISRGSMSPALSNAEQALKRIELRIGATTGERVADTGDRITEAQQAALGGLVIAILIAAMIGIWLMRSISGPVRALDRGMRAVAEGDLGHHLDISTRRRDEFGRLAASFSTRSDV